MEVTIDGRKVTLEEAVTVLDAARSIGVDIPTLCWHPRVSVLGACRLCMVEVEGINRLLAACTTQVSDGMVVNTDTPQLRKVRQMMLELLLCRHPLDCPTCVKGGECQLQELAYRYSSPENRFPENPAPYPVRDPSPFLERDRKKCILCRRCVRVCREVRGVTVLGAMERGYHKTVGTYFQQSLDSDFQEPYNCEFCGACIDICPVGALNKKHHKFLARSWEGRRTDSVCPFCSFGCLLSLHVKEGELARAIPREGGDNEDQACFRGRFGTEYVNSTERLITPMLRRNGKLVPEGQVEAVRALAGALKEGGSVEAILSSSLTREEARAVREFMKIFVPQGTVRAVDTLGLEETVAYAAAAGSWKDLEEADLVLVAGQDFTVFEPVAGVRIRTSRKRTKASLITLDSRDALLGTESDLWVRPTGNALPLLLAATVRSLAASHGGRLNGTPESGLLGRFPEQPAKEVEEMLAVPAGTVEELARRLAESKRAVFLSHRGWYDPPGLVPLLLAELDRLLDGEAGGRLIFLGRDCNSRGLAGTAAAAARAEPPDLLLLFGADPVGTGLPGGAVRTITEGARRLVVFDTYRTKSAAAADVLFPLPHFAEKDGSFVAAAGAVGKLKRAMEPNPGVFPLWDILDEVAVKLGQSVSFTPSLQETEEGEEGPVTAAVPECSFPPPAGERSLVLRAIPIADQRIRLVDESAALFPGARLEVHPGSLEHFGLRDGGRVRLVSGKTALVRTVKADLKTPPARLHLPCDPHDEDLTAFIAGGDRPQGWPADMLRLSACEAQEEG